MRLSFAAAVAFAAVACGGGNNPAGPSAPNAVVVQGVVLGEGASVTASSGVHASAASKPQITVKVEGTSVTANVSASGTFVLENVPSGTFTLVFESNGKVLGTVVVTAEAGATVKVVVQVQSTSVVLVDLKIEKPDADAAKTCAIAGGTAGSAIELEGNVLSGNATSFSLDVGGERSSQPVTVNAGAASFTCNGSKKTAAADCKSTVKTGAKVHVRGTLTSCTLSAPSQVTATEVKVQKAAD